MKTLLLVLLGVLTAFVANSQNLYLSGGNTHSVAICENGSVLAWGLNNVGQVGVRVDLTAYPLGAYSTPQQVFGLPAPPNGVRQIDAGSGSHTLALACNNRVYAWGVNSCGQLGNNVATTNCGTAINVIQALPVQVLTGAQGDASGFLVNARYVSGGNDQSFAILTNGELMAWGQGNKGELGNGLSTTSSIPVYVLTAAGTRLTGVTQVDAGDENCYALAGGIVYSWGDAVDGGGVALGRATANSAFARPVLKADGTSLNNIVQISGGDRHGLAVDASGNVWSWGGDWGLGQLGQGDGYQSNLFASLVKAPAAEGSCAAGGAPYLTGVTSIAAGQAHSLAVMADGRVVSWGANGFFNCGTNCASKAGQLGIGMLADGSGGAPTGVECPKYVQTSAGVQLQNIVSVSDGDAWSFAVSSSGQIYIWGWNLDGQLGLGTSGVANNRTYATALTLPGCAFAAPCPVAALGPNQVKCPVFTQWLYAGSTGSTYSYTWEWKANITDATWTLQSGPVLGPLGDSLLANRLGYFRVSIDDNRATVTCAPCPIVRDTMQFTPAPNPYTSSGCADAAASMARFTITAPAASKIKWYTNSTLGTALNPLDSNLTITVPFSSTNTTTPGCARALFADDVASFPGVLRPGTTVAASPCAGAGGTEGGSRSPLMIEVSQNLTLTGVSFIVPNNTNPMSQTYTIRIYTNDPAGGWNCGGCTPANSRTGGPLAGAIHTSTGTLIATPANSGDVVRTLTTSYALTGTIATPVRYWITVEGGDVKYLNCTPAWVTSGGLPAWVTPQVSSPAGMRALMALKDNGNSGNSHVFNITFTVGTGYACGRILVCISSTCILPVEYASFTAEKQGLNALVSWSTSLEKNSAYFMIEKSTDGITFESIGRVEAAGNSSSLLNYSFFDNKLASGTSYYRLAQYDIDGKVNYSEVKSVSREGIKEVKIVPNPNNGSFTVFVEGLAENAHIKLILRNALSQVVYESSESVASASNVNIQHLPSSIYFLEVQTEEGSLVTKVVKE